MSLSWFVLLQTDPQQENFLFFFHRHFAGLWSFVSPAAVQQVRTHSSIKYIQVAILCAVPRCSRCQAEVVAAFFTVLYFFCTFIFFAAASSKGLETSTEETF